MHVISFLSFTYSNNLAIKYILIFIDSEFFNEWEEDFILRIIFKKVI